MTGTPSNPLIDRAPILVLGLGNILLADDGVGQALLARVRQTLQLRGHDPRIELLDGGTQGLALLPIVSGRHMLLILDALAFGAAPGAIHLLDEGSIPAAGERGRTAHESNAAELLAATALLGEQPETVAVVGIEPGELCTRLGLSGRVNEAVPAAAGRAVRILDEMIETLDREEVSCTS